MRAELPLTSVVTFVAVDAIGEVLGNGQPQSRDELRDQIRQTVRDAVQGAHQGAADAGRAAADADRLQAQLQQARDAVAGIQAGAPGTTSLTRDGNGNMVLRTPDGRQVVIGEGLLPAEALQGVIATLTPPPPQPYIEQGPPESVIKLTALIFTFITLMVLGVAWARAFARRGTNKAAMAGAGVGPDVALRLERIEQSVDAMAVEMERVSEAQRYAARLLTERLPEPQLAAGSVARATSDRG